MYSYVSAQDQQSCCVRANPCGRESGGFSLGETWAYSTKYEAPYSLQADENGETRMPPLVPLSTAQCVLRDAGEGSRRRISCALVVATTVLARSKSPPRPARFASTGVHVYSINTTLARTLSPYRCAGTLTARQCSMNASTAPQ